MNAGNRIEYTAIKTGFHMTPDVMKKLDDKARAALEAGRADPGVALAPGNIEAQLTGAMVYGLSAAMGEEITFADGAVEQLNFPDYDPLRMSQMPETQVRILEIQEHLGGVGEVGTPPAAPALANALFDLRGTRYRSLPLNKEVDFYV